MGKSQPVHSRLMLRCFELARIAFENGNTPVGSVVAIQENIIAEGIEALPDGNTITGHAELLAIQDAINQLKTKTLSHSVLYSTAEPCLMCSYVIRNCEISQVVYCVDTPIVGGATSAMPILVDRSLDHWKPSPTVVSGVLKQEFQKSKSSWKIKR